ncbi:MAG: hypothetical protein JST04_17120 [Bdellovibrionales bacterium]|nr:hypothetical protein [Bdellovibrionales bacterium]
MVPIHESDVAENRWKDDEWRQFELWERIELRLRRKRGWTILAVALVFVTILAVPIVQDRLPKWRALNAMRVLAVRANQMKVDAAALGVPLRLRIENSAEGPQYVIERIDQCDANHGFSNGIVEAKSARVWGGGPVFENPARGQEFVVFEPREATQLGLERVTTTVCYDPLGNTAADRVQALGILTAKDLTDKRLDRVAFLNFSGLFAEIDFD